MDSNAQASQGSPIKDADDTAIIECSCKKLQGDVTLQQITQLQGIIHQLSQERADLEKDFGLKRARFRELYLKKEDELALEKENTQKLGAEMKTLRSQNRQLQTEADECRSLATVVRYQKENEVELERQRCQEEIASLQHILKEAVADAIQSTSAHYEKEVKKLKKINEKLESELSDYRLNQGKDREGVLAVVTKSLRQRVGGLGSPIPFASPTPNSLDNIENLEESMKKAQEDAEMLRSLVMPLEEEIKALKDKLRNTDNQLQASEAAFSILLRLFEPEEVHGRLKGLTGKDLASLKHKIDVAAEDVSPQDLKMFVTFVHIQNNLLQRQLNQIKQDLMQVQCQLLKEQKDHASLQQTWQIVNDQFLEAQRMHRKELARLQAVLTVEQARQLQLRPKTGLEVSSLLNKLSPMIHRRYGSADNKSIELVKQEAVPCPNNNRCQSVPENLSEAPAVPAVAKPRPVWRSASLSGLDSMSGFHVNFNAPPHSQCSRETHASSSVGTLRKVQSGMREPCELCSMYRHQVEQLKLELHAQQSHSHQLEEEMQLVSSGLQAQVAALKQKHEELSALLLEVRRHHDNVSADIYSQLKDLSSEREDARREIITLQSENDTLLGKHLSQAQKLQTEAIDLPDNLEESQFLSLKLREELITALVSREKVESVLRTENLFLQEQLQQEQEAKAALAAELSNLREQTERAESATRRLKLDDKLQSRLFSTYHPSSEVQARLDELSQQKLRLEDDNQELRGKIMGLQADLDVSEGVQRDFVKLSQTLQVGNCFWPQSTPHHQVCGRWSWRRSGNRAPRSGGSTRMTSQSAAPAKRTSRIPSPRFTAATAARSSVPRAAPRWCSAGPGKGRSRCVRCATPYWTTPPPPTSASRAPCHPSDTPLPPSCSIAIHLVFSSSFSLLQPPQHMLRASQLTCSQGLGYNSGACRIVD